MRVTSARFLTATADPQRLPSHRWPEIAFAGRSNVGKSSLLNRLVGRHKLARVSKTPGRTQQLNFFLVNEKLVFVDLPGYGFARVPLDVKREWQGLVESYLTGRRMLRAVVVIVDLRRRMEDDDRMLLDFLAAQRVPALVVATKADKLGRNDRDRQVAALQRATSADVLVVSSITGDGMDRLWVAIERAVGD